MLGVVAIAVLLKPSPVAKTTVKHLSVEQESWVADLLEGRRSRSSGASITDKGDVITSDLLIECKYTDKASKSIKRSDWLKITQEAYRRGRRPALALRLREEGKPAIDLLVLSIHEYAELHLELEELRIENSVSAKGAATL